MRVHRSVSLAHLALFHAEAGNDARVCAHNDAVALLLALARGQQPQTLACYARRLHTRGARQSVCIVCARARSSLRALRVPWTWLRALAQIVSQSSGWRRAGAAPTEAMPRSGCAIAPTRQPLSPAPRPSKLPVSPSCLPRNDSDLGFPSQCLLTNSSFFILKLASRPG